MDTVALGVMEGVCQGHGTLGELGWVCQGHWIGHWASWWVGRGYGNRDTRYLENWGEFVSDTGHGRPGGVCRGYKTLYAVGRVCRGYTISGVLWIVCPGYGTLSELG